MDWRPLPEERAAWISRETACAGRKERTGILYRRLAALDCGMDEKVRFILGRWGWDGRPRPDAEMWMAEIRDGGFPVPESAAEALRQLWGLRLPGKTQKPWDEFGCTLEFRPFDSWKDMAGQAEMLGVKYDDMVIPVGLMKRYGGWSLSGQERDGWEDPDFDTDKYDALDLFCGESSRIYSQSMSYADYVTVEAGDWTAFFASQFGLCAYPGHTDDVTCEEMELWDRIDRLYAEGDYRPGQFRRQK